jgi:hypothetical protein
MKNLSIVATFILLATFVQRINEIFQSKHCTYNGSNAKFVFYTREYFSKSALEEYLLTEKIIVSGAIKYTAPTEVKKRNQNTSTN